jgi:hypothetical protein
MIRQRRTLLLGLAALLLLALGIRSAIVWQEPISEAEKAASRIEVGMTADQALQLAEPSFTGVNGGTPSLWEPDESGRPPLVRGTYFWVYRDGSVLTTAIDQPGGIVTSVQTRQNPINPLTRLRRTLAHAFPFLTE